MDYVSSITVNQVIDALAAVITPFMQGGKVIRGQVNRVPLPSTPCAVLTELLQSDLSPPTLEYDELVDVDTARLEGPKEIRVQVDFYGEISGELCNVIKLALRSPYGYDAFPVAIKPLYCDDGIQAPLTSGEKQYVSRWTMTVVMQYNPSVSVPQEFASEAELNLLVPADIFYV